MASPKSSSLFHFTKSLDSLLGILEHGFHPRYCLEDLSWCGVMKHVAFPTVCFCDIPLSRIEEHTGFYGSFGLGLTKTWGQKNDLNPVIYCKEGGALQDITDFLLYIDKYREDDELRQDGFNQLLKFLRFVKPVSGHMYAGGELVPKEFYQESEWRYSLLQEDGEVGVLSQEDFELKKDERDNETAKRMLQFLPSDINYIFVERDSDIPVVVDFINKRLGRYPLNDLKILTSRITSLAMIESDL